MSRPLRIEYAGALYHVTSRGDRREAIYHDDQDRAMWLDVFGQVCRRYNWRCHAWCLMDNHYHVVVETAEGNLSKGMRQLNGVYTQKSNRRHSEMGHVFQGRYKAILVEKNDYLLELSRYVVLNPIRAGMENVIGDWIWSSYRAMVGKAEAPDWFESDWLLACFGRQRAEAVAGYTDFVRAGIGLPSIWKDLRGQLYLGSDHFVETIRKGTDIANRGDLSEISRLQRRPLAKPLSGYAETISDRKLAMVKAWLSGDYTMKEISESFSVHYSTVSRAIKVFEANA